MELDALLLSRVQFGFTIAFHIIFPAFTIGLASYLAMLEFLWLVTKRRSFRNLYDFWVKIFAVSFGMGVVSGIVLSYQIGTNWSAFSRVTGNVLGPLLSYEVLTAFFLEASFLSVMLFGWKRVGPGLHFFSTLMVALGTLVSAFWILSANSWMNTPAGFEIKDGVFHAADWWAIVFNPSFPYRFLHMTFAAYLTTALMVAGISAWHLRSGRQTEEVRTMHAMAVIFLAIMAPLQVVAGDLHGLNTLEHQPAKVAAMEAHWETRQGAPLILFAWPDEAAEKNRLEIAVPKLASLILTHSLDGEVKGLTAFPEDERPPVKIPFFAFRLMVGLGILMVLLGLLGVLLLWSGRLFGARRFQLFAMSMTPAGFVAVISGWLVTEVGRQPYVVYGLRRTAEAVSPLAAGSVAGSLAAFVLAYAAIFGAGSFYLLRLVLKGPAAAVAEPPPGGRAMRPFSAVESPFFERR